MNSYQKLKKENRELNRINNVLILQIYTITSFRSELLYNKEMKIRHDNLIKKLQSGEIWLKDL